MAINPDRYQAHVDRPNSQILVAYLQDPSKYQADQICKSIPTQKQSDLYFSMPADQWMRSGAQVRAPATMAPRINYTVGTRRFDCKVYSVAMDLDDITTANFDAPLDPETDATELIANDMRLRKEIVAKQSFMQPNMWTGWNPGTGPEDYDPSKSYGNGQWDLNNAQPAKDVSNILKAMGKTGFRANFMWMARNVADGLKNNPAIYSRFTGVIPQFLTDDQLANILGIETLLISDVCYNSAQERQASNSGYLLDNEVLIGYRELQSSVYKPSFGYSFVWTGLPNSGGLEAVMKRYRDERYAVTSMEGWAAYTFQPVCLDLAVRVTNVLSKP